MYLINVTGVRGARGSFTVARLHPQTTPDPCQRVAPAKLLPLPLRPRPPSSGHPVAATAALPYPTPIRKLVQWPPSRELKLKI